MPVFLFHQPPSDPQATSWEFRMTPPGVDGQPDFDSAAYPVGVIELDVMTCYGPWLRDYCERITPPPLTFDGLPAWEAEVEACTTTPVSCHRVTFDDLGYDSGWLQSQACGDTLACSQMSKALVVPEFSFIAGLMLGALLIGVLHERSRRRRAKRRVSRVR